MTVKVPQISSTTRENAKYLPLAVIKDTEKQIILVVATTELFMFSVEWTNLSITADKNKNTP